MPDHRSTAASCLVSTSGAPVPLVGVAIGGDVCGAEARVVVRQRYRNEETAPIEAIYTFPLPSDATLVGFAMECAGRRIEGEVKEREEAFRVYDDALTAGHGAALLEEERRNVFTANVGNLLPGEETVVEVIYVQHLAADEGALRVAIPTLVAPRYVPGTPHGSRTAHGTTHPTDRVPDADRISPGIEAVAYGLSLDLTFDLGRDVTVESPSHRIVVTREDGGRQRVAFHAAEVPLDRDLVLLARGAPGVVAGVVAHRADASAGGTFALTVVPDLFEPGRPNAPRDVVFVVDVSGSMGGVSIEQAKTALALCLRHLSEGDRFDVIAFSDSHWSFAGKLVPYTQATLERADAWVKRLQVLGGTEMREPLLAAVDALAVTSGKAPRDRLVVLLTDGQVGNEAEIVEAVVARAGGARVYTFGIGTNTSDLLLRDLARRTRGAVELIHPGERIDDKVTAQFARATAARIDEVTLGFQGVDAGELAPATLPALVDGEPWVVYGRYSRGEIGRAQLRGVLRCERFLLEIPVDLPDRAERPSLAALWATARIRDLEESERLLDGRRAEAQKKRIVELAIRHGVASKYTSFVVVERRTGDRRAAGQGVPAARPVPVNAPAGWSRFDARPGDMRMQATLGSTRTGTIGAAVHSPRPAAAMPPPMPGRSTPMPPPPPMAMAAPKSPPPPMQVALSARLGKVVAPLAPPPPAMAHYPTAGAGKMISLEGAPTAAGFVVPAPAPAAGVKAAGGAADSLAALFGRQLASGLWTDGDDTPAAQLLATARALARCAREGVDSTHAVFGAQVKKAVEATCRAAAARLAVSHDDAAALAALAAALLVATGRRLRGEVQHVARELVDDAAARSRLAAVGIAMG